MPNVKDNPHRGCGLMLDAPRPRSDASHVAALLANCPRHAETPLINAQGLAGRVGVASVWVKDERERMGLGSFKALGAAFVIARDATDAGGPFETALADRIYVAASAGNHGMSVAAGARIFGAKAIIYLAESVPEAFAKRLIATGAEVVRAGAQYEDSMAAAMQDAEANGWTLLSDSTWDGYLGPAMGVMEGYLQMANEAIRQIGVPPTHILLQAGVGGLAASVAAAARKAWGDAPKILVVEPEWAPALQASIAAGALVTTDGPVSEMGRLDCKTASLVALRGLSEDADLFVTITEEEAAEGIGVLEKYGLATTPSGGAGLAAILAGLPDMPSDARVLAILSEGPEDA